jgi:hypothetical protein
LMLIREARHASVGAGSMGVRVLRLFRRASSQLRTGGRLLIGMNGRLRRKPQSQKGTLSNRMGNGALLPPCFSAPLHRRLAESGKTYCFTVAMALPWPQERRKVPVSLTPR